ncbi:MAG: transcription termination/antitermination NusG family protein [Gammaproteobacteria bacterium]
MSIGSVDWFAVYTKPQQEQTALVNLERQSFECYLPMAEESAPRRNARSKRRNEPLFPRYLFLGAASQEQNLAAVRSTRGVVGLVRAGLELTKIPASIITALKTRMHPESGLIRLDSKALKTGDKVQLFVGPFADMEGVFQEHRGETRSLLLLEILGRKTTVEVDARLVNHSLT